MLQVAVFLLGLLAFLHTQAHITTTVTIIFGVVAAVLAIVDLLYVHVWTRRRLP